jgi:hypothetical protein
MVNGLHTVPAFMLAFLGGAAAALGGPALTLMILLPAIRAAIHGLRTPDPHGLQA